MLTRVRDELKARSCEALEDCFSEEQWNALRDRVADEHGVPVDALTAALVDAGTYVKRQKKLN